MSIILQMFFPFETKVSFAKSHIYHFTLLHGLSEFSLLLPASLKALTVVPLLVD